MISSTTTIVARGAVVASVYVAITMLFAPISFGVVQFRVAEALTLLPFLWIEAVPGLFVGCLLANLLGGFGPWDVILGSVATLVAAVLTRLSPNLFLAALAPVVVNGLVVGAYLTLIIGLPSPLLFSMVYVAAGEAMACYGLGMPLVRLLERRGFGVRPRL